MEKRHKENALEKTRYLRLRLLEGGVDEMLFEKGEMGGGLERCGGRK